MIGYHHCSERCGRCGGNYIAITETGDTTMKAECWEGHSAEGTATVEEVNALREGECPQCGRERTTA